METYSRTLEESNCENQDYDFPSGWNYSCMAVLPSCEPFKLIPVNDFSSEFEVIASLLPEQYYVKKIERIINPCLWKDFKVERKKVLESNSSDVNLLRKLGVPETDINRQTKVLEQFGADSLMLPFSDNMAILCHGTSADLNAIFSQGLDDRLGRGRLLGNGIYFSDDPLKSEFYARNDVLLLFMVLIGDCVNVGKNDRDDLVQEPEKEKYQMRNPNGTFFDSVVGNPPSTPSGPANEFVIYSRSRCCPLYSIHYEKDGTPNKYSSLINYSQARKDGPLFAFGTSSFPTQKGEHWPFLATNVIKEMQRVEQRTPKQLEELNFAGFMGDAVNRRTLKVNNGDVLATMDSLYMAKSRIIFEERKQSQHSTDDIDVVTIDDDEDETMDYSVQTPTPTSNPQVFQIDCPICRETTSQLQTLSCKHIFCTTCAEKITFSRITMSGIHHTSIKCPLCNDCVGIYVGDCPDGTMRVSRTDNSCSGYDGHGTLEIVYQNRNLEYPLYRTGFLPDTPEGREILKLLTIAWDRRISFTISHSNTTGKFGLVWNIHHMTSMTAGPFGYPDPMYFERFRGELKENGVE